MPRSALRPWAALLGRLLLAAVFGYAAVTKIGDPAGTVRSVRAYRLLPDPLAVLLGHALPSVELALAALLLLGVALRVTAAVSAALLLVFLVGIVSADVRGLAIECGCFGSGGTAGSYGTDIVRDLVLLVVAVGVWALRGSRWALAPSRPAAPVPVDPGASGAERRRGRVEAHRFETAMTRHASWTRRSAVASVAALVLAGATGVAVASATAPAPPAAIPAGVTSAGGVVVGSPSARHLVIAYEDPQCPVCGQFEPTNGRLLAAAVAAGRARVEYRMRSFLGEESVRAVAALGAAQDDGKFEALREQLFAHQPQERTGGFTLDDLVSLGAAVGLGDDYAAKVRDQTYAAWAGQVDDRASKDGNTGTPELIVDGTVVDASSVPALTAALA